MSCARPSPPSGHTKLAPEVLAPPLPLTVHQWITRQAPDYLDRFGQTMPLRQREVLQRLLRCRTPELGGQAFACADCGCFHYQYHSCNDRHCPRCGQADADEWLERQRVRLLLPVPYFLVTFTVPEALRSFLRSHPQIGLELLFACSARSLQDLAGNPRHLGAQLGLLGVLHTWTRTLAYHPHIHYLVPGGGLSPDRSQWRGARNGFLLPIKPLGLRLKTLFEAGLKQAHPELYAQVPAKVWRRHWNVDSRAAGSGQNALRYLARYVFKTATGNRVVPQLPDGRLRWDYTDSRSGRSLSTTFDPDELLRRFLQHVLPKQFARVRTFGWLHPAAKERGNRVRALLGQPAVLSEAERQTWLGDGATEPPGTSVTGSAARKPGGVRGPCCPRCGKPMILGATWRARGRPPMLILPRAKSKPTPGPPDG